MIALSVLVNAITIAAAVLVISSASSLLLLVPILAIASVLDAILVRRAHLRRRAEDANGTRDEAVRRIDYRRRNSIMDETTGLYTRWYFDRRLEEEASRCKRYKHSMAVVVLRVGVVDLTTFSLDSWQKRSMEAAQRAAKVIREVDISASISPFEFAICLVHCDREGAYRALERMLLQLTDYNCEAGVVVFPDEGFEPSALVEMASARLRPLEVRASA